MQAREQAAKNLQKASSASNGKAGAVGQSGNMPEIALSADLQYDLTNADPPMQSQQDDPKRTKEIVKRVEEACGIQTIQQVVEKAERHQDTSSTLTEMRKNLQTKVITLLQKRDMLKKQLDGEGELMEDDEATRAKKFDEKEKHMLEM